MPSAFEVWSLNHCTIMEVPRSCFGVDYQELSSNYDFYMYIWQKVPENIIS